MKNREALRRSVYGLGVLSVLTFFSGFLEFTSLSFIPTTMYFLILTGGAALVFSAIRSGESPLLKGLLVLSGVSIALVGILANNPIFGFKEREGLEYLFALVYLIGTAGSLILMWARKAD